VPPWARALGAPEGVLNVPLPVGTVAGAVGAGTTSVTTVPQSPRSGLRATTAAV